MTLGLTFIAIAALSASPAASPSSVERGHVVSTAIKGAEMESDADFKRNLRQIKSKELQTLLPGSRLIPPPQAERRAVPFAETFSADGTWVYSQQRRALFIERGRWHVDADSICVSVNDAALRCRKLFRNEKTQQLFTHEFSGTENNLVEVKIVK